MKSKTIDGVPRDVLMTVLSEPRPDAPYCVLKARAALRALLDAPAAPVAPCAIADALESAQWPNTSIGNKVLVAAAITELRKASKPQGEPVAWMYEHDGLVHNEQFKPLFYVNRQVGVQEPWSETPLYAEQPAPQGEPVARQPDAIIEGVMTSVGITHVIYASTVSLKHGEQVKLYAEQPAPVAPEVGEPYAYEYEFATVLYSSGPGKFKKVLTLEAPDQHEIDAGCVINVKPLYSHERRKYDDTLLPFLALMRKELHANSHKGDREGWLGMDPLQATSEIYHHAEKLAKAVAARDYPQITEYTADVANCAMMLLDVCGGLGRA